MEVPVSEKSSPETDDSSSDDDDGRGDDGDDDYGQDYMDLETIPGAEYIVDEDYDDDYSYDDYDYTEPHDHGTASDGDMPSKRMSGSDFAAARSAATAEAGRTSKMLYIALGVMCVGLVSVAGVIACLVARQRRSSSSTGHGDSLSDQPGEAGLTRQHAPKNSIRRPTLLGRYWKELTAGCSTSDAGNDGGIMEVNPQQNIPPSKRGQALSKRDPGPSVDVLSVGEEGQGHHIQLLTTTAGQQSRGRSTSHSETSTETA